MIYVLLISSSELIAAGVREILSKAGEILVIGIARSIEEAEPLAKQWVPDIAIIDTHFVSIPKYTELKELIDGLKSLPKQIGFIDLADWSSRVLFELHCSLGVKGYCLKTICGDELIKAIKTVAQGETYIHDDYAEKVLEDGRSPFNNLKSLLGDRQIEILNLILHGYTNREIADRLYISLSTVKSHVRVILKKLNARDRADIISRALQDVIGNDIRESSFFKWFANGKSSCQPF